MAGMNSTAASAALTAATVTRPAAWPRRARASPAVPPASTPSSAPTPTTTTMTFTAAGLAPVEVVADERGDQRPRGRRHDAEEEPRDEQHLVAGGGGAPAHRHAPQRDGDRERPCSPDVVREHAERECGQGADEQRRRDQ